MGFNVYAIIFNPSASYPTERTSIPGAVSVTRAGAVYVQLRGISHLMIVCVKVGKVSLTGKSRKLSLS